MRTPTGCPDSAIVLRARYAEVLQCCYDASVGVVILEHAELDERVVLRLEEFGDHDRIDRASTGGDIARCPVRMSLS